MATPLDRTNRNTTMNILPTLRISTMLALIIVLSMITFITTYLIRAPIHTRLVDILLPMLIDRTRLRRSPNMHTRRHCGGGRSCSSTSTGQERVYAMRVIVARIRVLVLTLRLALAVPLVRSRAVSWLWTVASASMVLRALWHGRIR
ncbi:hypothetical protein BJX99DRAFT_225769 [Aspergillus californicus]